MEAHHELNRFGFYVQPLKANPLDHHHHHHHLHRKPLPVQLSIKFVYVAKHKHLKLSLDGDKATPTRQYKEMKEAKCQFDLSMVNKYDELYRILSGMLSLFGICRDGATLLHDQIVEEIIMWGRRIGSWGSNKGRKILPLCVFIQCEHAMVRCERCLVDRVGRESPENSNCMLPASGLVIKKILKRVKLSGC